MPTKMKAKASKETKSKMSLDPVKMLKEDHKKVKALFDEFEKSKNDKRKEEIVKEALQELKVHAALEEEIFYPAVREAIDEEDIMNEADEEHHMAKVAIAELENLSSDDQHWEAKFIVLGEMIRHHIKEEEGEMLPEAEDADLDMEALAQTMVQRKEQLMSEGVPETSEARMVAAAKN